VADLLALVRPSLATAPEGPVEREGFFEHVGARAFDVLAEARDALGLLVDTVYWSLLAPARGKGFR
jgi:hypothetical protein